jgi:hypothetical protein
MKKIAFASGLALGALICFPGPKAEAGGDAERIPPVTDPVVLKECGSCHIPLQPALLPGRSWQKVLDGLKNHFGEDASLSGPVLNAVTTYLTANAAEKDEFREWALRGLGKAETPLRVTEMPWFVDEHGRHAAFSAEKMSYTKAKSKADCKACHQGAALGYYDDLVMEVPRRGNTAAPGLKSMQ